MEKISDIGYGILELPPGGSGGSMSENDGYDEVPLGGFGGFDNEWNEG